ncbi:nucleotidyltransferase domain-containing protein [Chthonobacter rhizosphaerae]|uniref:nucleotidyltransferase domain-containing protein n=1 Tax=Chthonobacter rhizosphaerae TaxID=2735553 RepID=UPI0015EE53FD|nr:nucleotidyltransferase domain-containing protein [Chthonobacter rhizosphaerae]
MTRILPQPHSEFLERICDAVARDPRIHSLLAAGSFIHGGLDEFSDLDFILVAEAAAHEDLLASRQSFAEALGPLLSAFTGEHVGEPRLLICLYGPPLLHVDLKVVTLADLHPLIERPAILVSRDRAALEARLDRTPVAWPNREADWFEARAWIWLHYGATKLGRGELFEAMGMLAFFREQVLGPMLHRRAGLPQRGVRRIEALGLNADNRLAGTVARHETASVRGSLLAAARLYLDLRSDDPPSVTTPGMPGALEEFIASFDWPLPAQTSA